MWPEPLTRGMDRVRDIGGARLVTERDREWAPESGEAVRGRYGIEMDGEAQDGELGDAGLGSVLRRMVGGLRSTSVSRDDRENELEPKLGWLRRKEGTGEDLNSSIRSVSGTGSMVDEDWRHMAGDRKSVV